MKHMITINGKEHPFRYGYGALMLSEEILGKPWGEIQNLRANLVLMWCCLLNADGDFPLDFEQLLDACDEDASIMQQMGMALSEQLGRWGKPSEQEDSDDKKKD
jgi:hypothetical protein